MNQNGWEGGNLIHGHYTYYCGQESLRRNGVALKVNKKVRNAVLGCSLNNKRMISAPFQGKPHSITVIQVYAPTTNAQEAGTEQFCEDLQHLPEQHQKKISFHHRELEFKSRKSRAIWDNRQVWPWRTIWNRAKTNSVLPREHTGHSKHPLPTTQEMTLHMDITGSSIMKSNWLYILCKWRWRSSIKSAKIRPRADYGSNNELLLQNSGLNLRK